MQSRPIAARVVFAHAYCLDAIAKSSGWALGPGTKVGAEN
jgi:hypothetical protein